MLNRGINFKQYYSLFNNLADGRTDEMSTAEYRDKLLEVFAEDLEQNFLGGKIYKENIKQLHRNDCVAKLLVEYNNICTNKKETMYVTFLDDCVSLNGLFIKY